MEVASSYKERGSVMDMAELLRWALGCVALLSIGCGVDAGETGSGGGGGSGGSSSVCPEDPADGPVLPECGVWVSIGNGHDDADGTQDAPVASLTRAIELAEKGPGRVYACDE